jgi:hypothetical protein
MSHESHVYIITSAGKDDLSERGKFEDLWEAHITYLPHCSHTGAMPPKVRIHGRQGSTLLVRQNLDCKIHLFCMTPVFPID